MYINASLFEDVISFFQLICGLMNSPEVVKNEPYGEKADIWALGCILYQMATLKPPFYSSNMLSLASKVTETHQSLQVSLDCKHHQSHDKFSSFFVLIDRGGRV